MTTDLLPPARRVLAIVAHPDDESFGLGGIIAAFVLAGVPVDVLCFTHGEASTLGRQDGRDLGELRTTELAAAGDVLGVERTELLAWPDGGLADRPVVELAVPIAAMARETEADMLLSFDESGVTGHHDHRRASEATDNPVLWRRLELTGSTDHLRPLA